MLTGQSLTFGFLVGADQLTQVHSFGAAFETNVD
jgi:hypothetical protein